MFAISLKMIITGLMARVYKEVCGRKKYIPLSKEIVLWILHANIHGAADKGECVILVLRNIQLVYMAIKLVRKTKSQLVETHKKVIGLWHVEQLR